MRLFILLTLNLITQYSFSQTAKAVPDFIKTPEIKWEYTSRYSFYASPVVKDSLVYIGGLDSILHAIDINTGKEKWSFQTKGEIRSNVCIHAGCLYLNGGDGIIYCLDNYSGRLIWKFQTRGESKYDFADYFHSTPILYNDVLFFGSGDTRFYALDAENGKPVWAYKTGGIVHSAAVIDNNKVFFGSFDGNVYALNLTNGKPVWKFKTVGHQYFPKGEVQGSPAAFDNKIFIGARDYNVYALDQEKGYCHWNKSFSDGWGLCNNIYDSVLYIGTADERKLISVNPATGSENWSVNMEFLIFGNNAYSDSMLYVGTTIGKLHGFKLKNGSETWSFETESYQDARLKYFKFDDSYRDDIYSIIKSNEQFLEVECELGGVFSTPCITNNLILFSSTNGKVYCLKDATDSQIKI